MRFAPVVLFAAPPLTSASQTRGWLLRFARRGCFLPERFTSSLPQDGVAICYALPSASFAIGIKRIKFRAIRAQTAANPSAKTLPEIQFCHVFMTTDAIEMT